MTTEIASKEFEQKLLACVHCGFCLTACPTYTRLGDEADSPRGRIYLMRAVQEGRLAADDPAVTTHIDRCLGCRACETVCPSAVEYGFLLERARDTIREKAGSSFMAQLLLRGFGDKRMARVASFFSRVLRASRIPHLVARRAPNSFGKLKFSMAMLAASAPARGWRPSGFAAERSSETIGRVALLTGCVQEGLYGRVNRATEYVIRKNGFQVVDVPAQQCCGALHAHSGELDESRARARENIAIFERANVDYVIVNAAGCGAQMKQYGELLEHDAQWSERAHAFARKVRDVSEFLSGLDLKKGAPLPWRVTFDAPCHLYHAQRITTAPLAVLQRIPEITLIPLPRADECCGGAGIYGLLHQELGGRILKDKIEAVLATGADIVVTPNPGCMMQIGAGMVMGGHDVAVMHPMELLAESYARAE